MWIKENMERTCGFGTYTSRSLFQKNKGEQKKGEQTRTGALKQLEKELNERINLTYARGGIQRQKERKE